jgi:hypothetical protein
MHTQPQHYLLLFQTLSLSLYPTTPSPPTRSLPLSHSLPPSTTLLRVYTRILPKPSSIVNQSHALISFHPTASTHSMQTRSKTKIGPYKTLLATNQPLSSIDLHPTSYTHASKVSH